MGRPEQVHPGLASPRRIRRVSGRGFDESGIRVLDSRASHPWPAEPLNRSEVRLGLHGCAGARRDPAGTCVGVWQACELVSRNLADPSGPSVACACRRPGYLACQARLRTLSRQTVHDGIGGSKSPWLPASAAGKGEQAPPLSSERGEGVRSCPPTPSGRGALDCYAACASISSRPRTSWSARRCIRYSCSAFCRSCSSRYCAMRGCASSKVSGRPRSMASKRTT